MKNIYCIVLLFCSVATAQIFGPGSGKPPGPPPPAVVDCVVQPRDFAREPQAAKKDWNKPCVLDADVSSAQLANVKETAAFLNARLSRVRAETKAVIVYGEGVFAREAPINPIHLSFRSRAEALRARLSNLAAANKLHCAVPAVVEANWRGFNSGPDWRGELRRPWMIGQSAVGLILLEYAGRPVETADAAILSQSAYWCEE